MKDCPIVATVLVTAAGAVYLALFAACALVSGGYRPEPTAWIAAALAAWGIGFGVGYLARGGE